MREDFTYEVRMDDHDLDPVYGDFNSIEDLSDFIIEKTKWGYRLVWVKEIRETMLAGEDLREIKKKLLG